MGSLLQAIANNLDDARALGTRFPLRHLTKLRKAGRHGFGLPGLGKVWLRTGTTDAEVFRQVFKMREYDLSKLKRWPDIVARYDAILGAGRVPLIIDAGANIGVSALWFARAFPAARIIAVEPEPANAEFCRANIAAHPQISLREAAIGAAPGTIVIDNPAGLAWSPRTRRSEAGGGIKVVTVVELAAESPDAELFMVKVDIEGFESDLFAANTGWIDDVTVLLIEIHDWMMPGRRTSAALQKAMGTRGFEMLISGENLVYLNLPES